MSGDSHSDRVVIVGGGISGLSIARRLAEDGLAVTLIEASRLGGAASSRNQGWLHSGGWFAPADAELARHCYESLDRTLQFCPACIEPQHAGMAYLFVEEGGIEADSESPAPAWTAAWSRAGIPFDELPISRLESLSPDLDVSQVRAAYLLPDRSIRTGVLLSELTAAARKAGADIREQTPVVRLLYEDERVTGVATANEEIAARFVILGTGTDRKLFWSEHAAAEPGRQASYTCVALKAHLVSVAPGVGTLPFCVVDCEGFHHIPHATESIFGLDRWRLAANPADQRAEPEELDRVWRCIRRFFSEIRDENRQVTEWAGTTVQAMHVDQVEPGVAPRPTVIDHSQESPRIANLLSVFPGRATLWPLLAEETCRLLRKKLASGR